MAISKAASAQPPRDKQTGGTSGTCVLAVPLLADHQSPGQPLSPLPPGTRVFPSQPVSFRSQSLKAARKWVFSGDKTGLQTESLACESVSSAEGGEDTGMELWQPTYNDEMTSLRTTGQPIKSWAPGDTHGLRYPSASAPQTSS